MLSARGASTTRRRARDRGLRAARRRRGRECPALRGGLGDRSGAADLVAAAAPARPPRRVAGGAYHPASQGLEVGGDFYDVFSTAEGQWYLVIGDVCGKGAEAAAVTALARHTLRTAATRRARPPDPALGGDAMLPVCRGRPLLHDRCAHVDLLARRGSPWRAAGTRCRCVRRALGAWSSCSARRGRCSVCARSGAAGAQHRPAVRRRAGALYGRADRGARAAGMWGEAELAGRFARRRSTGRSGWSRAWSPGPGRARRSAGRSRGASAQVALSSSVAIGKVPGRLAIVVVRFSAPVPSCRCGVPSAGVSSTSGGCSSGYPTSDSVVSI